MKVELGLKWNDLWVGAYWKNKELSFRPGHWAIFKKNGTFGFVLFLAYRFIFGRDKS